MLSSRAYRLAQTMRMLSEARIGRVVSVENAQGMYDALVLEQRLIRQASGEQGRCAGPKLFRVYPEQLASAAPSEDDVLLLEKIAQYQSPRSSQETEDEDSPRAPLPVAIRTAFLLANGQNPTRLMIAAAVSEIHQHMSNDGMIKAEFKRLHTDVLCNRLSEEAVL